MSKIERLLEEEKNNLDNLDIPDDLEARLRHSLNNIPERKKRRFRARVAAIIIVVLLLGYNIDTLAYYGKRLLGYDTVMNGTLQELNELGKGQIIEKSHTFSDGVSVTLDGVMLDDNNLIMFYTIEAPENNVDEIGFRLNVRVNGFSDIILYGGQGETDSEGKFQRWIIRTDRAPKSSERQIGLNLQYRTDAGKMEEGQISFNLDRKAAVGKSIRFSINKRIKLDGRSLRIESLVASPTSTVVKGEIQNIFQLGLDYISGDRFRPELVDMVLLADGKEVQSQGSGMSTNMNGMKYDIQFDALPQGTSEIELRLKSFGGDYDANKSVKLNKGDIKELDILGQEVKIEDVYEESGNTYITFTSEEGTTLSRVYLNIDGERYELKETIPVDYDKVIFEEVIEGSSYKTAKVLYTRTMRFEGIGDSLELEIQRIRFSKDYDMLVYSSKLD